MCVDATTFYDHWKKYVHILCANALRLAVCARKDDDGGGGAEKERKKIFCVVDVTCCVLQLFVLNAHTQSACFLHAFMYLLLLVLDR